MTFEYVNIMFILPFISYHFALTKLEKHSAEAIELWELLEELEVTVAVLNYRTYMPITCRPEFTEGSVTAKDIHRPLLREAVVNPVNWQENTLVIGSNASGKSTCVKSIVINCILAQTIRTAIAEQFTLQPEHVLTSMVIEDDLFEGDSYFVPEIKSIKRLLNQVASKKRCCCFVDEVLKGTSMIERIASSASVVRWLAECPFLTFVVTHSIKLTRISKNYCENVYFEEQVTEGRGIGFSFKLREGPSRTRNVVALPGVLNYSKSIVEQTQKESLLFDGQRQWYPFDQLYQTKHDAWVQKDDYQKEYTDTRRVAEFDGNESTIQTILEDLVENDTE